MNLKTTIVLAVLVCGGALAWCVIPGTPVKEANDATVQFLEDDLRPEDLTRIEIVRGDRKVILEQSGAKEWSLPGKWPVRTREADALVDTLTHLRTRFTPMPLGDNVNLKEYGLAPPALLVKFQVKGKEHTLAMGEENSSTNRFSRATYGRLDDGKEIVRLAPGLIAALDHNQEYFQKRQLFPADRVAKDNDPLEKVEQASAKVIAVKSPEADVTLTKKDKEWEITAPVKDHVDPDKLRAILNTLPDIWAEKFVDKSGKKMEDFGLKDPQTVIAVTRPGGSVVKLMIGSEAEMKFRKVAKPPMPQQPFMPPKQDFDVIPEAYRFAKLADNDQIFEIKADNLKNVAVSLGALRDAHLARFQSDQVKRVEIETSGSAAGGPIILVKDKDQWKLEKPHVYDAENGPINDLLDKLAGLQAKDANVLDKVDLKTVGLEKPAARIKINLEDDKTKTAKTLVYDLGVKDGDKDKDKDKTYIRVEGWPRVNVEDDAVLKLARRPDYAYHSRKMLDIAAADLGKVEIQRGGEAYAFRQDKGTWKMIAPVEAKVDSSKVSNLASALSKLEAVEIVTDAPKTEDLDKVYGLAKPSLTAKLDLADAKKPAKTITLGKAKGDKEFYARVDNGPVFVVKKDIHDDLNRDSLAYRPLEVVSVPKDKIHELAIQKDGQEYRLVGSDKTWKVRGPFDAPAAADIVDPLVSEFASVRAERHVAHSAKDLKDYGLDKPYLVVRDVPMAKEDPNPQLVIGKTVDKSTDRFAKLGGDPAIFVLSSKTVAVFDHGALDFLDKKLLSVDSKDIRKLRRLGSSPYTLEKKKEAWEVVDTPAPPFTAEEDAVRSLLRPWSSLQAERIAAYGPKIDWAGFGLDKPAMTVNITVVGDKEKTMEHQLAVGKEGEKGSRFVRLDKQDQVAVLDAADAKPLIGTYLDLVDHRILKFDLDTVMSIERKMPGGDLQLLKKGDSWRFAKPTDKPGDDLAISEMLEKLFRLRAQRIVAYPAMELTAFGLNQPITVTLKLTDAQGRPGEHVIKVGKQVDDKKPERYAQADKGDAVVILGPELSHELVAPVLFFADRNLPSFPAADKIVLERPGRKVAFTHGDTGWSMTDPIKAEAEDANLDEVIKSLRRLRADEVVADGGDLKPFGLDRPQAEWHIQNGGKDVMALLVGNANKEGRRYGKLASSGLVFTLGSKLGERLLEEYRSRKPWPALDAVQVDKLTYKGPMSFTLKKNEKDWNLSTNLNAKVNSKQVSDTLDALAGLKAERYVADAKADLKLYGLDPPLWTVEAETSSGTRTLLIGRLEGDSQRAYATVPGSGAVFVIGAAEVQRILRPLAGFTN